MWLADSIPQLVTESGNATTIGVLLLMLIMLGLAGLAGYNQVLGAQLKRKQLNAPEVVPAPPISQPFSVVIDKALEEKFVGHGAFSTLDRTVTENRKEVLEAIRKQAEVIQELSGDAKERGEQLGEIKADSRTHTRQLSAISESIGKLREDLGFQKGRTERK